MLVGWGRAYGAFVRGLECVRVTLAVAGDEERAYLVSDAFCSARYTGLAPGDGGARSERSWSRAEVHAAGLRAHVDTEAVLAAWGLGGARGVFELLWAEDDRVTREQARGYLRRAYSAVRGADEEAPSTRRFRFDDAPPSAA